VEDLFEDLLGRLELEDPGVDQVKDADGNVVGLRQQS